MTVEIIYDKEEQMQKEIDTWFKKGFAMGHDNLDEFVSEVVTLSVNRYPLIVIR